MRWKAFCAFSDNVNLNASLLGHTEPKVGGRSESQSTDNTEISNIITQIYIMAFTAQQIEYVWSKGTKVPNYDPAKYRKDACGAWIARDKYGDKHSPYGWQIDHIYPESKLKLRSIDQESIDHPMNLRPMHWKNNVSKGSDYPAYHSIVKAVDNHNEDIDDTFEVNSKTQEILRILYGI